MPDSPNKLSQFWQELKRRKVVRVITVYAAASFVILELISIVTEPFGLPEWTLKLVFVLLLVGFIIAIILSWIYDIHPEGGVVKTEPARNVKDEDTPESSNGWKIASYISFVVIVGLIILNIVPRANNMKEILDKSIAVLPFKSLSDDPEKQYLADGTMDAILLHLSKIEDLRVMARTSVEQYRETDKTVTEICQELDVAFLLEGSFQKYGDQARLIVQLIEPGKEGHVWVNDYNREWKDIFSVQSEVAQTIARELRAVITPEEKGLIEKIPTTSLTAYDFYQRGREEHIKYWLDNKDKKAHEKAEDFYNEALVEDPAFASAFTGLTIIYHENNYHSSNDQDILDSILIRSELALSMDDQEEEAYYIKAVTYKLKGDFQQAIDNYEMALSINPNYAMGLRGKGLFYAWELENYVQGISSLHKAASIDRSSYLVIILTNLAWAYQNIGFFDEANFYIQEATRLGGDSSIYYQLLAMSEYSQANTSTAEQYLKKATNSDTNRISLSLSLPYLYLHLGHFEELLGYYELYIAEIEENNLQFLDGDKYRIGMAYWINGYNEKAENYFNKQIKDCNKAIELGLAYSTGLNVYFDLSRVYACLGDQDKAIQNLRIYSQKERIGLTFVRLIENDPAFDIIRDDHEFAQVLLEFKAKYQAEHERVRRWLEENDML